jgi:hypothetical protein
MNTCLEPLEVPDSHFLNAAQGWLELGDWEEAKEELEHISAPNRAHPRVLLVQYWVYSRATRWDIWPVS